MMELRRITSGCLFCMLLCEAGGFAPATRTGSRQTGCRRRRLRGSDSENEAEIPPPYRSTKMETSAELPERFNYKVQALMGNFDPPPGTADDERQDGNILSAMLKFPAKYTFTVVGKTKGYPATEDSYVKNVKAVILENTGDEEGIVCKTIPRGKNFLKVECEAIVLSATMINNIYDELDELKMTVMRF
ncbi:MAG: hypothetical protein SGILL_003544 [Bacillariaceae sp.]